MRAKPPTLAAYLKGEIVMILANAQYLYLIYNTRLGRVLAIHSTQESAHEHFECCTHKEELLVLSVQVCDIMTACEKWLNCKK